VTCVIIGHFDRFYYLLTYLLIVQGRYSLQTTVDTMRCYALVLAAIQYTSK